MTKKILRLGVVSLAALLAGCWGGNGVTTSDSSSPASNGSSALSSQGGNGGSSGGSSSDSSSSSSGLPDPRTAAQILEDAIDSDYTNLKVYSEAIGYGIDYSEHVYIEHLYQGFTIIQPDEVFPITYFHDYEGLSYQYFEADPCTQKEIDQGETKCAPEPSWIREGYADSIIGLDYQYLDVKRFIKDLKDNIAKIQHDQFGYYTTDSQFMNYLASEDGSLASYYDNYPSSLSIVVDPNIDKITKVIITDSRDVDFGIVIEFFDFGLVTAPSFLPPVPTANMIRTYYGHYGQEEYERIDVTGVTIDFPAKNATGTNGEGQKTGSIGIDELIYLDETFIPSNANYSLGKSLDWFTDDSTVIFLDEVIGKIRGLKPGTARIWAVNYFGIKSNTIEVTVVAVNDPEYGDPVHSITFTDLPKGETENTAVINDLVADAAPVTVTTNTSAYLNSNNDSNKFPGGYKPLVLQLNSASAYVTFDFGTEQVNAMSFYLSLYFSGHMSNMSRFSSFSISIDDGAGNWTPVAEIHDLIKSGITSGNYLSLGIQFPSTSKVRLFVNHNNIGSGVWFASNQFHFYDLDPADHTGYAGMAAGAYENVADATDTITIDSDGLDLVLDGGSSEAYTLVGLVQNYNTPGFATNIFTYMIEVPGDTNKVVTVIQDRNDAEGKITVKIGADTMIFKQVVTS